MSASKIRHDYYKILQIPPTADTQQIRSKYRSLAREKHPDKNPSSSATSEFQLILEAYSTLTDPVARSLYDAQYKQANLSSNASTGEDPQTRNTAGSGNVGHLERELEQFRRRQASLSSQLHTGREHLARLQAEEAQLQREIEAIAKEQAQKATWWHYLTSSLLMQPSETEEQRHQRDRHRLDKIAAESVKKWMIKRQMAEIQNFEREERTLDRKIKSTEFEIRRDIARQQEEKIRKEQELRYQEFRERMAEQSRKREEEEAQRASRQADRREDQERRRAQPKSAAKEGDSTYHGGRHKSHHHGEACRHQGWWNRIEYGAACSRCFTVTRRFAFKCRTCDKIACASCRDILKGK
ncbi:hypothetical protein ASPZODRAFT_979013 [Penicilliopsis zonata CBS 506.65]|uniref:J domain-containing protein n=1 Tax=Penicilliopsis zonata CBS 506.65 TaxID=1073090 RepID=A0A1L9SQS5_9EURO|nr:hypothetical protein ASPZODRAFT_979013 [Penicilliopsis zonata CBS 506.65]OJJ49589.1 hypothetical protein ASPZODRAFT_979013 [Penicilliopsis zonata CBS 506.65]